MNPEAIHLKNLDAMLADMAKPRAPLYENDDSKPFAIGDGFGDGGDGAQLCDQACDTIPGTTPLYQPTSYPSRSHIPASRNGWQWVIAPTRTTTNATWPAYAKPENTTEGEFARMLREARLLHALRVDRQASPDMIANAESHLADVEDSIRAEHARTQHHTTAPLGDIAQHMGKPLKVTIAILASVFVATQIAYIAANPPPARIIADKPAPKPGIGWLAMQNAVVIPYEDKRSTSKTTTSVVRYESPYVVTRTNSKGRTSSTAYGPRSSATYRY